VIVQGVGFVKRHNPPPNPQRKHQGRQSPKREASIHVSNVMAVLAEDDRPHAPRCTAARDGRKVRIARRRRGGAGQVSARLKDNYVKQVVPTADAGAQVPHRDGGAAPEEDRDSTWASARRPRTSRSSTRRWTSWAGSRARSRRSSAARSRSPAFKLRQGMPIAAMVTLRGDRMYEFLDRLFNVALPRVRDFRGVPTSAFDGRGSYTLGLRDQIIFPEIDYAKVEKLRGMNVTFVTTARTDEESRLLLQYLGMPFRTQNQ
jgi:large subunit ribosomal protein L5